MSKKHVNRPLWHPILWPSWLLVLMLFCLSRLSMPAKQRWGARLGRLLLKRVGIRSDVTRRNIRLCFPQLETQQQEQLIEDVYVATVRGFFESTHAWWGDMQPYVDDVIITGAENLQEARARNRGIFLIGGHYSIYDFALPLIANQFDKSGYLYRSNDNPVIDRTIEKGRRRHCNIQGFDKSRVRDMIAFLQDGGAVWYACDQDFGRRCELFVPFFGVDAGCITTPSWIARESGASVMCVNHLRHPNGQYEIGFSPILEEFGQDERQDAQAWNRFLEATLSKHPEQYLWLHKRFKTRPEGAEPVY